ncbi:MAG TPA: molybdate ABC transporter substrate-binding protein [Candidatus Binatia bacterium]|nr:molybdate ABC transporter substrate-binding protein [Candidatus Binatia bacterium]
MKQLCSIVLGLLLASTTLRGELLIAAASDLRFALDELITKYAEQQPAARIKPVYGSSGNFYAQIMNDAPFDLFFSADASYPRQLITKGKGKDADLFVYAIGRIVIWVPKNSPIKVEELGIKALLEGSVKKVAIANPEHAPYGRAAVAAMKKLGVYDRVSRRLVLGENIAQTAQFVESGNADIGIIAYSLAIAPKMKDAGRFWEIPLDAFPRLEQAGLVIAGTKNGDAAREFRTFMQGKTGQEILNHYGFILP